MREEWAREWPAIDTSPIDVVARVGRLAHFFDEGINELLSVYGIRREGWDVLASLRRAGPPYRASPTELYRRLMRTSGAMTNRLNRLESAGLIARVPDPADARGRLVELTEAGHRLVERLAPLHLANEGAMLEPLTPAERAELAALLAKILVAFEDAADPHASSGPEDAGRGSEDAGRGPEDAGRGPEDAGRGPEDAGRGPEDAGDWVSGRGRRNAGHARPGQLTSRRRKRQLPTISGITSHSATVVPT